MQHFWFHADDFAEELGCASSVTVTAVKLMDGSSYYLFILSSLVPALLLMASLQQLLFFQCNQLELDVIHPSRLTPQQ